MNRDWKVEMEKEDDGGLLGGDGFLETLRARMEQTLLCDATEPKKVSLGDYLKLAALLETARRSSNNAGREVVIRWEDPSSEETEDAA
ncbi:MAG: hypothetical protein LC114_21135 [Bryobacterales bacterium]|nr:hypothetical protein [Bryobacterales bacterium]